MICYMLHFSECAQQVLYHNYVHYVFFEQSIFILSYWISDADLTTGAAMNAFFVSTAVISSMSTGLEGHFEIADLDRCPQPV